MFLWARRFVLRTDHQALVTLLGAKNGRASMRIGRWVERLKNYNFEVKFKAGITNLIPDMLSRLPTGGIFEIDDPTEIVVASVGLVETPLKWGDIAKRSLTDPELEQVRRWISEKNPRITRRGWASVMPELAERDGVMLKGDRIVLPAELRAVAFKIAHNEAHQGIVRTKQKLRALFWWPSMDKFVEEAVVNCHLCAQHDKTAVGRMAPSVPTTWPDHPWQRIGIDIRGPDDTLGRKNRFAVVVVDYYSKWAEVELMPDATTSRIICFLQRLFHREGIPEYLVSDNGKQFTNWNFKRFLENQGVEHIKTPVYHPQANGLVERFNRTLGGFMMTTRELRGDFPSRVAEMVGAYNATPQATTGRSPAELLHGRPMRTRLNVKDQPQGKQADELL